LLKVACRWPGQDSHPQLWVWVYFENNTNLLFLDVQGYHGIEEEVFLSLPVIVGENGINAVFNQKLDEDEVYKIKKSGSTLREIIDNISI